MSIRSSKANCKGMNVRSKWRNEKNVLWYQIEDKTIYTKFDLKTMNLKDFLVNWFLRLIYFDIVHKVIKKFLKDP